MSLFTSYEGLRHQIERLVRENEELKKLVRLIRENHELKSAIKTQAGGLDISGFTSGHGESASGPSQRQDVFLTPSPAAANDPVLEEVGIMALAPLADMLSSPQPSPPTGPILSPMMGPLSTLLPSPGPITHNSALASLLSGTLNSHLASPMAMPLMGTLASSLGLPSTGPLPPSSPLNGPMAVSPVGTLASSMGLASIGPLTQSSPLAGPLANPMSNMVLSEAPRVRLPEPLHGSPSGPHPSAAAGPAATSKVILSSEHTPMTQDPETLGVTFVGGGGPGGPTQTSTPVSTVGTPSSMTTFCYGTSGAHTQQGTSQGQAAPAPVPTAPTASHTITVLPSTPAAVPQTAAPQAAAPQAAAPQTAANYSPLSTPHPPTQAHHSPTRPSPTSHSPTRNTHSPPRTSSSPASVNNIRGPRVPETSRKTILDLERKLAHRKTSKFPDTPREPKQLAWERLVGEIAFQLDRRILSSIFPERVRLYGFTVSNIPEKIIQASLNPSNHKLDEELCHTLTQRYVSIMNRLQSLGYSGRVHPALTEQLVNAYGILRERPELAMSEGGSYTMDFLQHVLVETVHPSMLSDALLLLSCLSQLAHDDGKPMFIW